jgi:hypothetical protein
VRAIGIPAFGLAIPQVTGLYGPIGPSDPRFWMGTAIFVGLSALIWHGNRWLLFQQRRRWTWLDHPVKKLLALLAAIAFYTAPITVAALVAWYRLADLPVAIAAVREVALMNVICVIFVTHAYETVFLIKERESDQVAAERLERARVQAQLDALHAQIDPHFLFNSLNTLSSLIEIDPVRARSFNERLARVYRYLLQTRDRRLVSLAEELAFLDDYCELVRIRFGDGVAVRIASAPEVVPALLLLPPNALQLVVENAVKHNRLDEDEPLVIELSVRRDEVVVENPRRARVLARPSARVGLHNLNERYKLLTEREIAVSAGTDRFAVTLPLVAAS